jgi:hypothetical protein
VSGETRQVDYGGPPAAAVLIADLAALALIAGALLWRRLPAGKLGHLNRPEHTLEE